MFELQLVSCPQHLSAGSWLPCRAAGRKVSVEQTPSDLRVSRLFGPNGSVGGVPVELDGGIL